MSVDLAVKGRLGPAVTLATDGVITVDRGMGLVAAFTLYSAAMKNATLLYSGSTGLNTRVDPARIRWDPETGVQDLAVGVNVDIDDSLRVSRRKGFDSAKAGTFHSLYPTEHYMIAGSGDALCLLYQDLAYINIRTVTPGAQFSYEPIGDRVYYANGYEIGYVENHTSRPWTADDYVSDYVGPSTSKAIYDPPIGHILCWYNGRIYIAQENNVWESREDSYHWFEMGASHLPLSSRVTMVARLRDGLLISDELAIWAYIGPGGTESFRIDKVADYPAIEGTLQYVQGQHIGDGTMFSGMVPIFTTLEGICIGGPGGQLLNISKDKVSYPRARYGAALIVDNEYIVTLKE